jgi:LPS-assembly protein
MRFYTTYVRHKQKGFPINCSYKHFLLALLLLFTASQSFGFNDSQWDCKLANDGETWDCSTSTKPLTKATKPNTNDDSTGDTSIIAETPVKNSTEPSIPRVKLAQQPRTQTAKKTPVNVSTLNNTGSWECQASEDSTWDCAQISAPTSINIAVNAAEETDHIDSDAARIRNNALFHQMVKQLDNDPWDTCEVNTETMRTSRNEIQQDRLSSEVQVQSDYAEILDKNDARFTGDVQVKRADQSITADQVTYNSSKDDASATGDVFYQENGFALYSEQAELQLANDTGQFKNNQFILEGNHARGTTKTTNLVNRNITQSTHITYTTCAPSVNDWELQAQKLELNKETGRGTGRDVWVEVFDIPLLYTPYISFPIDDRRQSGVLAPTFGSSDTTGIDLAIPYYWNIAENYDATITPRIMSDRGLMLGGEFRYLSNHSEGQIAAEILSDTVTDDLRGQFSFQNKSTISPRLSSDIDLNYISDDEYFEDFGNTLISSSNRYLRSQASLNYRANNWNLLTKIDNYDSIDDSISSINRPHRRLPQVLFNLHETDAFGIAKIDMRNEFVYFEHSADVDAKRVDLHPGISIPFKTPASFITPRVSLRHTSYRLNDQAAGIDNQQSRTLPILSVDSGLFFERELNFAGGLIQTLEPRAYYLYVPHKDQDDIPLFDTSEYDFSFNQLFRENRYSGADRVADANQLTLAVTSRFIESDTGSERLRASLGTIVYFDDLDVGLNPTSAPITTNTSDLVTELSAKITDTWSARSALQYDPHASRTEKATLGLHYRDGANRLFNATYRSRYEGTTDSNGNSNDIEQTDLSFKWPISKEWSTVGRWNYSEEHNLSLDTFLGLEKDTCCWRLRVIARRYVNDALDEEPKEGIFFQFELKGLTSFGEKLDSFLEEGILGYQISEQ